MNEMVIVYCPWILSFITVILTVLQGNKWKHVWWIGCVNQALWLLWIVYSKTWGFLPLNICMAIVYARNHFKWMNEKGK